MVGVNHSAFNAQHTIFGDSRARCGNGTLASGRGQLNLYFSRQRQPDFHESFGHVVGRHAPSQCGGLARGQAGVGVRFSQMPISCRQHHSNFGVRANQLVQRLFKQRRAIVRPRQRAVSQTNHRALGAQVFSGLDDVGHSVQSVLGQRPAGGVAYGLARQLHKHQRGVAVRAMGVGWRGRNGGLSSAVQRIGVACNHV